MEPMHQWAPRCLLWLLVGEVLVLGYSTALAKDNNTQLYSGFQYDHLQQIGAESPKRLTITRFSGLLKSGSPISVRVTSNDAVTGIDELSLAVIKHGSDSTEQGFVDTDSLDDIEENKEIIFSFPYDE
ncbi:unnamed protein product, partial [Meganyctiphanes norvegica]